MFEQFTRQADSTHCVVYGNGTGELLVSYWTSEAAALDEATSILLLARSEGFDAHPRVESLATLDALETGSDDAAVPAGPVITRDCVAGTYNITVDGVTYTFPTERAARHYLTYDVAADTE